MVFISNMKRSCSQVHFQKTFRLKVLSHKIPGSKSPGRLLQEHPVDVTLRLSGAVDLWWNVEASSVVPRVPVVGVVRPICSVRSRAREGERAGESARERASEREGESKKECVCERERAKVCEREKAKARAREREREGGRERERAASSTTRASWCWNQQQCCQPHVARAKLSHACKVSNKGKNTILCVKPRLETGLIRSCSDHCLCLWLCLCLRTTGASCWWNRRRRSQHGARRTRFCPSSGPGLACGFRV